MQEKDKKTVLNAAKNMIKRYGDNALAEVDLRIAELRMQKQPEVLELWENIRTAVKSLSGRSSGETLH